jgi:glycine oxidase
VNPDVIVVGGGIIGTAAAWRLAQRGMSVTVIDSSRIGGEASRAGAGMLAPGGEAGPESPWARRMVESHAMYPGFVQELESASSLPIEFKICGAYEFAEDARQWHQVMQRAEKQRLLGIHSEVQADRLFYPGDGQVKPSHVVRALVEAGKRLGIRFVENSPVRRIEAGAVHTGSEEFHPGRILLTAGAWASQLLPGAPPAFPVKGHLIGYRMAAGSLPHIERRGHHYILQRKCGFTIAGSTSETVGFDRSIDLEQVARLHAMTKRYVPGLPEEWESAWIGFRPGVDGEPRVERWRETNIWLAYGHFRNGILLAPLTAQLLSEAVAASSL